MTMLSSIPPEHLADVDHLADFDADQDHSGTLPTDCREPKSHPDVVKYLENRGPADGGRDPGPTPDLPAADPTNGVVGYYADSMAAPGIRLLPARSAS